MSHYDDLPSRAATHELEDQAIAAFQARLTESRAFVLQGSDRKDYGVDCQIEVIHDGRATNARVHVQLKGTARSPNGDGSISVEVSRANINYLLMQPYSIYVCFHAPTGSLLVRTTESVVRQYEHEGKAWSDQQSLTVNFAEELTVERLNRMGALARSEARSSRDRRIDQSGTPAAAVPAKVLTSTQPVHVPEDPTHAAQVLAHLYERDADDIISGAFEKFLAVLGSNHDAMGSAFMAEINLGMARPSPFPERIKDGIAHLRSKLEGGLYQPCSLHYSIGNGFSALGDEEQAKAAYLDALADPALPRLPGLAAQIHKNLGTSFERLGDEDQAVEHYRHALHHNPDLPEAHSAIAHYHLRSDRFAEALDHFDRAIFVERRLGQASSVAGWRANILFNLKEGRAAFREINSLLGRSQIDEWIWPWCARLVAAFGRENADNAAQALTFWKRYVEVYPDHSAARRELLLAGLYLHSQGRDNGKSYAEFREWFDRHITHVAPEDAALPWDRLGHWAQDEGDWAEAEGCFRHAYDLEGGHFGYCLGTALVFMERFEESLPLLRAQAEILQPDAQSWFQLGVTYAGLERPEDAIAAYRKALELDPDYDLAMFNLGGIHWNAGQLAEALTIWKMAIAQFPDHELAIKLRADIPLLSDA